MADDVSSSLISGQHSRERRSCKELVDVLSGKREREPSNESYPGLNGLASGELVLPTGNESEQKADFSSDLLQDIFQ